MAGRLSDGFLSGTDVSVTWKDISVADQRIFAGRAGSDDALFLKPDCKRAADRIVLAFILSGLSIVSKTFYSIYHMVVSLCDLIPGVALLPLAILWMGIGEGTIILIVVHSIIWPMSRSIMDGFRAVPQIYIESGENMGLGKLGLVTGIYIPASFSYILSGIRTGWARAWRGLISAEMIFGTTSSGAGIGWFIFMKRTNVDIAGVFAALLVIIVIGIVVEYGVFHTIEKMTLKKWGMSR